VTERKTPTNLSTSCARRRSAHCLILESNVQAVTYDVALTLLRWKCCFDMFPRCMPVVCQSSQIYF